MHHRLRITLAAALGLVALIPIADAMRVTERPATWPDAWPEELESIRRQSVTHTGGFTGTALHEIPLRSLAEFEQYLPIILRVRSTGSPITIGRMSSFVKRKDFPGVALVRVFALDSSTIVGHPPMLDEAGNRISSERGELWLRDTYGRDTLSEEELATLDLSSIVGKVERIDRELMNELKADKHFILPGPPWPNHVLNKDGNLPEFVHSELVDCTLTWVAGPGPKHGLGVRARVDIEIYIDDEIIDVDELDLPADAEIIDKMRFGF